MYKNLKNVIKYPSPEANTSTSPARGKVKKYRLLFSNNRFSLAKIRIMSLMQNKIFSQCTNQYIRTKYTNSKIANSSVDSVKTRREKILAYKNTGCLLLQPALALRNSDNELNAK